MWLLPPIAGRMSPAVGGRTVQRTRAEEAVPAARPVPGRRTGGRLRQAGLPALGSSRPRTPSRGLVAHPQWLKCPGSGRLRRRPRDGFAPSSLFVPTREDEEPVECRQNRNAEQERPVAQRTNTTIFMPNDAKLTPRFDSLAQEVYLGLWRTYDRLRAYEDELFAKFEITAQQYNVLRLLKAARPETLPTLSLVERLISRAPDVTRMIDRLEERGLVSRERSTGDRRVVRVGITDAGLDLLSKIGGPLAECHSRQLGHLSATELKKLSDLLRAARRPHEMEDSSWR